MLGWMMDVVTGIYLGMFVVKYLIVCLFILHLLTQNSPGQGVRLPGAAGGRQLFPHSTRFLHAALTLAAADLVSPWSWNRMAMETIILMIATIPCFLLFNSLYEYMGKRRTIARVVRKAGWQPIQVALWKRNFLSMT
jgi:rod shape-determining protein MreD